MASRYRMKSNLALSRLAFGLAASLGVALATSSCTQKMPDPRNPKQMVTPGDTIRMNLVPIADVLARQTPSLMTIKGVTGTGQGEVDGKPVIVVYTSHISRENWIAIPRKIEGYGVDIREVGDVKAPPR